MRFNVRTAKRGAAGRFQNFEPELKRRIERALRAWGTLVVSHAKRLILKGPKTGRIYMRRGVRHQASAPGEPPANDTGRLVGSIRFEFTESRTAIRVFAGTDYANYLEFGTSNMAARPFLRRAIRELEPELRKMVDVEVYASFR